MNIMKNYSQTSWGRILLMLRADFYSFGRVLLMLLGIAVLIFNFVARMGGFFGLGFETTLISHLDVASRFARFGSMVSGISLVYLYGRFHKVVPTPFTLIPANLWEKIVSIILGYIIITVSFFLMLYITVFIDWLFAPDIVSLGLRFDALTLPSFKPISWDSMVTSLAFKFGGLASILIICTQIIRYKSVMKAFLLGILYNTLAWIVFGKLIYYISKYFLSLGGNVEQSIEALLNNPDTSLAYVSYIIMGFFLVVDLALAYYIYYRLKKLEI